MATPDTTFRLPHELLLLSLDERGVERGNGWGGGVETGLAGALLLELLERGDLVDDGGALIAAPAPTAPPVPGTLLGDALDVIRTSTKRRKAKGWIQRLPKALKPIGQRVARELVADGVLDEERSKLLGLIPRTRYPEVDPEPERRLRERLRAVLVDGREPSTHDGLLISLLQPYDMVKGLVERSERTAAKRRAKEVAEQTAVSSAVAAVLRDAQAAVTAAVVASTVAATSASSSNC